LFLEELNRRTEGGHFDVSSLCSVWIANEKIKLIAILLSLRVQFDLIFLFLEGGVDQQFGKRSLVAVAIICA
jgi:hypothetical protein